MSFLSRKPARPDGRGRGDEYDDFDDYADDGYAQSGDDEWSPNQYFSPEGIKGKWAGENPAGRSGGRGQRNAGQDSYGTDFNGGAGSLGYEADEFETGMYDLPDGSDGDRRGSRRSRDREGRGERTGILRLRRDRGEDIWPEEDVSDEDYWASVAADRPFHSDAPDAIISHRDPGPWNIVARDGLPVGFIDWPTAGPTDRLDEVAGAAWLNAQLHDDDVAERQGLPDAAARARQLRVFLDGYGLATAERKALVTRMIEYAIRDCAAEAVRAGITPESGDPEPLWALAWRARSAAWLLRHRPLLERAATS